MTRILHLPKLPCCFCASSTTVSQYLHQHSLSHFYAILTISPSKSSAIVDVVFENTASAWESPGHFSANCAGGKRQTAQLVDRALIVAKTPGFQGHRQNSGKVSVSPEPVLEKVGIPCSWLLFGHFLDRHVHPIGSSIVVVNHNQRICTRVLSL